MIHIRELTPDDAPAIARIEAALHTRDLADGADSHRRYLAEALVEGVNLSVGAFDDDRLVGYLLCYGFEPTGFSDETGEALYLEDVAVLPEFRRVVASLFRRFGVEARKHFPEAALEGHALESAFRLWHRHPGFFARIGFPRPRHRATDEVVAGERRYLLRWDRSTDRTPPAPGLQRVLKDLPGHTIEIAGESYVVKALTDERDWDALEPVWDELLLATSEHTVFQSYLYQRLWWRHFGSDNDLYIVVVLHDGAVRGIAPLQIESAKLYGRYFHRLGFIGSRWEVDRPTLLFPRDRATLTRVLVRFLAQQADKWDLCDLHEQPTGSESLRSLEEAFLEAGYLTARTRDSDCPYLAIQGTWREFLAEKSQTFRKNLKTAGRRLQGAGEVRYQVYDTAPEVLEQLEVYRAIEGRSWKSGEGVGVSRDADYFEFYRELAELFARRRGFVIRMLTVKGKPIAGTFGLSFDGVFYSLQIAHDSEFSHSSPGTYLEALEMEECFSGRIREYEFLGGFLNNKSRWTSTIRYTTQLHVYRRTPFFRALHALRFRIKPRVKELVRPYMKSWRRPEPAPVVERD